MNKLLTRTYLLRALHDDAYREALVVLQRAAHELEFAKITLRDMDRTRRQNEGKRYNEDEWESRKDELRVKVKAVAGA
jgi:hypothetical protein